MRLDAQILVGDVIEQLRTLPEESVHCVVTSPPYWNLRDYKDANGKSVVGQIGLEPTLGAYIEKMVMVFEEVKRVLRSDGTCWVNLGDCYAGGGNGGGGSFARDGNQGADEVGEGSGKNVAARTGARGVSKKRNLTTENTESTESKGKRIERGSGRWGGGNASSPELKRKDLAGVPWRVALALQEAGWYLRCDIIWEKPNPMPESVYDRPTRAHEYVFLLTKHERYFYDHEAVKEPVTGNAHMRMGSESGEGRVTSESMPRPRGWNYGPGGHDTKDGNYSCVGRPSGCAKSDDGSKEGRYSGVAGRGSMAGRVIENRELRIENLKLGAPQDGGLFAEINHRGAEDTEMKGKHSMSSRLVRDRVPSKEQRADGGVKANRSFSAAVVGLVAKRSRRSVWTIATESYRGEHFATFPRKLVEPCLLAGTSEGGCCRACGAPRVRIVMDGLVDSEHQRACGGDRNGEYHGSAQKDYAGAKAQNASETKARILAGMIEKKTVGWAWSCGRDCAGRRDERDQARVAVPCVALDPFGGTMTVGEVALGLGRRFIGIDLSKKYAALGKERLSKVQLPLVMY